MMENIVRHSGSLGLPIQPQSSGTMMDMIVSDLHINSRMHFNSTDFCSGKILFIVDSINVIILNHRKNTA